MPSECSEWIRDGLEYLAYKTYRRGYTDGLSVNLDKAAAGVMNDVTHSDLIRILNRSHMHFEELGNFNDLINHNNGNPLFTAVYAFNYGIIKGKQAERARRRAHE